MTEIQIRHLPRGTEEIPGPLHSGRPVSSPRYEQCYHCTSLRTFSPLFTF